MNLYRIKDWDRHYENNRTRELKRLDWIPLPNKQDGDGYTFILSHENGPAIYGAFVACVLIASRCDPRGTLLRDNRKPHTPHSLARMSRFPAGILQIMFDICSNEECDWLEVSVVQDITTNPAPSCGIPALIPHEGAPRARALREGKGREGKEENPPPIAPQAHQNGAGDFEKLQKIKDRIGKLFNRLPGSRWHYADESALAPMIREPEFEAELSIIESAFARKQEFMSRSVSTLMRDWSANLDRARNPGPSKPKTPAQKAHDRRMADLDKLIEDSK